MPPHHHTHSCTHAFVACMPAPAIQPPGRPGQTLTLTLTGDPHLKHLPRNPRLFLTWPGLAIRSWRNRPGRRRWRNGQLVRLRQGSGVGGKGSGRALVVGVVGQIWTYELFDLWTSLSSHHPSHFSSHPTPLYPPPRSPIPPLPHLPSLPIIFRFGNRMAVASHLSLGCPTSHHHLPSLLGSLPDPSPPSHHHHHPYPTGVVGLFGRKINILDIW